MSAQVLYHCSGEVFTEETSRCSAATGKTYGKLFTDHLNIWMEFLTAKWANIFMLSFCNVLDHIKKTNILSSINRTLLSENVDVNIDVYPILCSPWLYFIPKPWEFGGLAITSKMPQISTWQ